MNTDELRWNNVTEVIIGCAYRVANTLGVGFLEKVYENALAIEIRKAGLSVTQQAKIEVLYDGQIVGEFFADLLVERLVVVELKVAKALDNIHMAQCLNYLRATDLPICLLINFGKVRLEIKRIMSPKLM